MSDPLAVLAAPSRSAQVPIGYVPLGAAPTPAPAPLSGIPQTPDELGELLSHAYDRTARQAAELSIPVVGSVQGGYDRRVIIYEWMRYKGVPDASGVEYRYGFVIRFCLTVSKWDVKGKLSLPFLSAQAQIGEIEASWMMQIRGLVGSKINQAVLPPQELNVETFVLAKQSLEAVISAIADPTTKFIPGVVLARIDPAQPDTVYWLSAVRAFAAHNLSRGRTRAESQSRLGSADPSAGDMITEVYGFFGIKDPAATPPEDARRRARDVLRNIRADV